MTAMVTRKPSREAATARLDGSAPGRSGDDVRHDPYFDEAVSLLGKRGAVAVLDALASRSGDFQELHDRLPKTPRALLGRQIGELESLGLVHLDADPTRPDSVAYDLTESGRELRDVLQHVDRWAHRWLERPARLAAA